MWVICCNGVVCVDQWQVGTGDMWWGPEGLLVCTWWGEGERLIFFPLPPCDREGALIIEYKGFGSVNCISIHGQWFCYSSTNDVLRLCLVHVKIESLVEIETMCWKSWKLMCVGKFWCDEKVGSLKKYFGTKHGVTLVNFWDMHSAICIADLCTCHIP